MTELVIHRRLASLDGFTVQTPDGGTAYTVKNHLGLGKASWTFEADGNVAATLVRPPMHLHPQFELDRPGQAAVTIRKTSFSPVKEHWVLEGTELGDLAVDGDVTDHEFRVTAPDGSEVGVASRSWVTVREAYGVRVADGVDPVLLAAAAIAFDVVEHDH